MEKYDPSGMYKVYDRWADIANDAYNFNFVMFEEQDTKHVVFAGMGGSGTLGDIFSAILSKTHLNVTVVKGYHLPNTVDSKTLVVTTSVSGNTPETLSVLRQAIKMKCQTISFSSGGKIQDYCFKNNLPHYNIKEIHSPRASLTVFLYSMLKILKNFIPISKNDVNESILELKKLNEKISSRSMSKNNPSLSLAEWLTNNTMIYYPYGLQAVAIRFKNSLQENAKIFASAEDIVEASHNGIVSWERPSNFKPILIRGQDDYIKTKERWDIIKEYFKNRHIDCKEIVSIKGNILSKIITLNYLLDYSTIYKAVLLKTNPTPVSSIDYIKKNL